jgi:tetratricopeptide (TPR) repeat protein
MMRLTRAQFASLKLLIIGLIAADLFAIWVWATRPPRIYSDWLGLTGLRSEAPFLRIVAWAAWDDGPRTPSGFLALFDLAELSFCGVLLLALVLLTLFLLSPCETDAPNWRRLSAKVGALQFRMRTALALLVLIGVYLGWEVHARRTWRLRSDYRRRAAQASVGVNSDLSTLRSIREERPYIPGSERTNDSARRVIARSRAAAASGVAVEDLKRQEVDVLLAKLVANTERKLKYERAAANPLNSVASDRPSPQTEEEAADWLYLRDYRRALAVYDELARTYPHLVEAHSRSAWLRATCPDAQYRDGPLAIESARRACELTQWSNPHELEVLAAACAEAGDFGSAVKWQKKVLTLTAESSNVQSCQERLALYLAGKAVRQP